MPRVLLIEDEMILAMDLTAFLQQKGCEVVGTVTNGTKALRLLSQQSVDLIICDIRIQGPISGLDTIRQLPVLCPVIFTTAFSDELLRAEADLLKPLAYLEKPVSHMRLGRILDELFGPINALQLPKRSATNPAMEALLAELMDQVILTEADWERFRVLFDRTYPGYLTRLRTQFPTLSGSDIRLICLSRLNLSTKEIASRLGISVDSVVKMRFRIRRKANLPERTDLEEVFGCI